MAFGWITCNYVNITNTVKQQLKIPTQTQCRSTNGYGGFDQFGALFGQVHVTGTSFDASETQTVELNLPGVRQRRWTSYDQEKVRRVCSIVGVCADGSVYILGAHSLERNLTK